MNETNYGRLQKKLETVLQTCSKGICRRNCQIVVFVAISETVSSILRLAASKLDWVWRFWTVATAAAPIPEALNNYKKGFNKMIKLGFTKVTYNANCCWWYVCQKALSFDWFAKTALACKDFVWGRVVAWKVILILVLALNWYQTQNQSNWRCYEDHF